MSVTMEDNIILLADSYKITHHKQYPPGTSRLKSYFESRGGKWDRSVFFGLQYILRRWLCKRVTQEMVEEADALLSPHFGADFFNRAGWEHIIKQHGGRLPLRIRAVAEGTVVPTHNVLFTVESTDPAVPWVTSYFETVLVQVWYPMTVATNSWMQKRLIAGFMEETADTMEKMGFMLHDFGYRGSTSVESAGVGGAAHLVNFLGTDTLAGIRVAQHYYGPKDTPVGFSVPATEHSTMTTWGKSGERAAVDHMLKAFPKGLLSVVSDSYDLWHFLNTIIGDEAVKETLAKREGTLVIRPDSGDPPTVVVKALNLLSSHFKSSMVTNGKGYKLLPPYLRLIQGDGVNYDSISSILGAMKSAGWSAENIVFGSGGALLQKVDRDTLKCAYKCCLAEIDGEEIDVFKDPVTDPGKKSKSGDLTLVKKDIFRTVRVQDVAAYEEDQLKLVFENGEMKETYSFEQVRQRSNEV